MCPENLLCELRPIFQRERNFVGVLFNKFLGILLFHQLFLQKKQVSAHTTSSVFTTNTSGQRRIHIVSFVLNFSVSSALMCGQGLFATDW
jgi:hypothetical protein